MSEKLKATASIRVFSLMKEFENAVREHAWIGSKSPDEVDGVERELKETRHKLAEYIERLENKDANK